ncbi:MAG: gluconokinase [SAR202 cluster bacterium]|jgi:gluconokinase|nr:gluconokinase [SAR202 cluster bacterium]
MIDATRRPAGHSGPFVLSIDVGSSSVKAALYDAHARRVEQTETRISHRIHATPDGGVEEFAEHLISNVETAIDGALDRSGDLADEIAGVGMDTMASTVMGLDADGNPATPIYTYADTRSQQDVDTLKALIDEAEVHQRTGCVQHPSYLPARFIWLQRTNPEVAAQVRQWVDPATFLYRRWFNRNDVPASYSLASWTGMLDRWKREWDTELIELSRVGAESLPPLADNSESISGLASPFAERWPALSSIPFFLAVGDGAAANIGSGCVSPDKVALTMGTSGAMRTLLDDPTPTLPFGLWTYDLGGRALLGGALSDGGSVVEWARNALNLPADDLTLDAALGHLEPAAHGLTALPFLSGERSPGWAGSATAAFNGLRVTSTATEMLQAALEATAYRFSKVWDLMKPHISNDASVVASGGALTASRYMSQMMSDVLGTPIQECLEPEATSRGSAILALHGLGVWNTLNDVSPRLGRRTDPDPSRHELYLNDRIQHEKLYQTLVASASSSS